MAEEVRQDGWRCDLLITKEFEARHHGAEIFVLAAKPCPGRLVCHDLGGFVKEWRGSGNLHQEPSRSPFFPLGLDGDLGVAGGLNVGKQKVTPPPIHPFLHARA